MCADLRSVFAGIGIDEHGAVPGGLRRVRAVAEVTDDKSLPKAERKKLQIEHAPQLSREARLVKLADKMRSFTYDPAQSFRGWLRTVAHHAWSDFLQSRNRPGIGSGDTGVLRRLEAVEAREDLLRHLEEAYDRELLENAIVRVRLRVQPHTWEAFRLLAMEGLSGADAAKKLGLKVATVFVAKSKVHKLLQEEVRKLDTCDPKASEASS